MVLTSDTLESPTMASPCTSHDANNNQDEQINDILSLTADETGLGDVDNHVLNAIKDSKSFLRGAYKSYTAKDRFIIGEYAAENGHAAAVRRFCSVYEKINESTVRSFTSKYKATLYDPENNREIPSNKRGRPLRLGPVDNMVVHFLSAVRDRSGHVSSQLAITVTKVLMARSDDPSISAQKLPGIPWAKSLFRRMGWKRRARTTGKVRIPDGTKKEAELLFLHDIVSKIEEHAIPPELVLNIDQTPSKYITTNRFTMAPKGVKGECVAGSDDKRSVTATFTVSLTGNFLGMQLIYGGKTDRSIPTVDFPDNFSLSANPKHYFNEEESLKVLNDIVILYLCAEKERLKLPPNHPTLLILDVFRGQMTERVLNLLKESNILFVKVPANMTHIFQPLDLSTNGWAKTFMKNKFALWYAEQIQIQLNDGVPLDEVSVKFLLTTMKPLHAKWLIELYNELSSEACRDVIISGWRQSGILDAIELGSRRLPSLDPFF